MTAVEGQDVKDWAKEDAPIVMTDERRGQLCSDELGTGYEEDTGLSSDGSADLSDREGVASQPESVFKPVNENKSSELTLEDLRATKAKRASSPDGIKAPGVLARAKEEVDAVSEAAMEVLNLKDTQSKSGDYQESGSQGGFLSRIAQRMGYDGHGRSQSH